MLLLHVFVSVLFCFFFYDYLFILQTALRLDDELDVLAGESHQLAVACPQINVLQCMITYMTLL